MAKIILTKTTQAITESLLQQLMPQFDKKMDELRSDFRSLQNDMRALESEVKGLRTEMLERFESTRELINEVAHRVTRVEGKLEGYMEPMRGIVVPVQSPRRRKAG
jgi:uncharacterized coiled-coil DUF342 family protein